MDFVTSSMVIKLTNNCSKHKHSYQVTNYSEHIPETIQDKTYINHSLKQLSVSTNHIHAIFTSDDITHCDIILPHNEMRLQK